MKAIKIISIIVFAIILLVLISFFFFKPLFYRVFYPWNRINGTIHLRIDGEKYDLNGNDLTVMHENATIEFECRKSEDGTKVSIHGGDYGPYRLIINSEGTNFPLEVVIFQYNWWNIVDFDLDISLDSASNKITFTSNAQVLNENGKEVMEKHSTSFELTVKDFIYYIVSL